MLERGIRTMARAGIHSITIIHPAGSSWKLGAALRRKAKPGTVGPVGYFAADDRNELLFQPPGKPWRSIHVNANPAVQGRNAHGTPRSPSMKSLPHVAQDT